LRISCLISIIIWTGFSR